MPRRSTKERKKVVVVEDLSLEDSEMGKEAVVTEEAVVEDKVKPKRFNTFKEALEHVGSFGRYQIFTCFIIQYASILWAGNYSFLTLGTIEPHWQCNLTQYKNMTWYAPNNQSDPYFCNMIKTCRAAQAIIPIKRDFKSMVQDWYLVCDLGWVPTFIHLIYLVGRMFGSIFGGHLGDHMGRRKGFFSGQFLIIITSVLSIASRSWEVFTAFTAVNGFFFGLIQVTAMTLMMEYTDSKHRLIVNAMFQWCLGYIVISLDWRLFLIIINLLASPLLVGYLLFHESPRWLVTKGRLHEAAEVLTDIGSDRWNNAIHEEITADMLEDIPRARKDRAYTFIHLFRSKELTWQSILQILSILTYSLIDATYFYDDYFIGNGPYMHLFFYGFLRLWLPIAIIVMDFKVPRFGRKSLMLTSLGVSALAFLLNVILLWTGVPNNSWPNVIATIIGTTVNVSALYMAIVQITTVAYPTVTRAIAFGTLHITTDIGGIIAIGAIIPAARHFPPLPYLVPLILIVITGALAVKYQPETKGEDLPDRYWDAVYKYSTIRHITASTNVQSHLGGAEALPVPIPSVSLSVPRPRNIRNTEPH